MGSLNALGLLLARVLLAVLFIPAGFNKITGYAGTAGYMESAGVPGILLPLVILIELGGGLLLLIGWQTRLVALALAGFTALSALLFHQFWVDPAQMINFWKNVAITGGLLAIASAGAGRISVDGRAA
ncbi:putative oxidoreductase [Chelatococcus caeni]|uniref:Putative oxidoreductase n=1 Tax=Chelatococcus caeni TaxID=1348468 RepID=A0A840C278_9HYPH|nr:DoxX family protein [Chelatococcus caeni]MBB4017758.1 putative oxidoreductase [Chelatococcus caeni]